MKHIFEHIASRGGHSYAVGGSVRDEILGDKPKDLDFLITMLPIDTLIQILRQYGQVDIVGKQFGVIKFRPHGSSEQFDFALPRTEISTGSGHTDFDIQCDPFLPVEKDLMRRDYAANSIAKNLLTNEYVDPAGGLQDLQDKVLRMVNNNAFLDDPLRILRGIQLAARKNFTIHPDTLASMKAHAHLVPTIAPERISSEFCKLLKAPQPSVGIRLMRDLGILDLIMPELSALQGIQQPSRYHSLDVFEHSLTAMDLIPATAGNLIWLRLTALLHDIGKKDTFSLRPDGEPQFLGHDEVGAKIALKILTRLKFSSVEGVYVPVDRICHLIAEHMFACDGTSSPRTTRRFFAKTGRRDLFPLLRLRIGDRLAKFPETNKVSRPDIEWMAFAQKIRKMRVAEKPAFSVKDLAIDGNDVMTALNLKPGKQIGLILKALFEAVLDEPSLNTKDELLALALKHKPE